MSSADDVIFEHSQSVKKRELPSILVGIVLCLVPAVILIIAYYSNRGFDLTDEGVYYLSYLHPGDVPDNQTTYYYFGGYIFQLLGYDIIRLRLSVLMGTVLSGVFFGLAFLYALKQQQRNLSISVWDQTAICSLVVLATMLVYSIAPSAWSYNHFNLVFQLIAFGNLLLFYITPAGEVNPRMLLLSFLFCGAVIGLDFFVKFSSSILSFCILWVALLTKPDITWRNKMLILLCFCGAILIFVFYYFSFVQPFYAWSAGVGGSIGYIMQGGALHEIKRYAKELIDLMKAVLRSYYLVFAVLLLGIMVLRRRIKRSSNVKTAALWWGSVTWLVFLFLALKEGIYKNSIWLSFSGNMLKFYLGIFLILAVQAAGSLLVLDQWHIISKRFAGRLTFMLALLLCLPFIGAVGTTNPIVLNAVFHMTSWIVLDVLLLLWLTELWSCKKIMRIGILVLACFLFSQIVSGYVFLPYGNVYGLNGTLVKLTKQNTPVLIGEPPSTLLLDTASADFINRTRDILQSNGFHPGDDIIGLFDTPGLVMAVGGRSPGRPWYFSLPSAMSTNGYLLGLADKSRINSAIVLIKNESEDARRILQETGLDFPGQYVKLGTVYTPYTNERIDFWKPVKN